MKIFTFDGRLGADAELRKTKNGEQYLHFTVANNIYKNREKSTVWYDVYSFNSHLFNDLKRFTKGAFVTVVGDLNVDTKIKDGRVYLNRSVRAWNIEGGAKVVEENKAQEEVSTYTGGTPSFVTQAAPSNNTNDYPADFNDASDDLPF